MEGHLAWHERHKGYLEEKKRLVKAWRDARLLRDEVHVELCIYICMRCSGLVLLSDRGASKPGFLLHEADGS